jgi:hypothetical protein
MHDIKSMFAATKIQNLQKQEQVFLWELFSFV